MKPGLVSVTMPAYNADAYIAQAIGSVLAQTYRLWELIIVDDGSSDRTAEIAGGYDDPRIRLVRQANGGEAAARNTALKHMQGEYLAFLDADDLYLPDHLELTAGYLSSHPDADGVYTDGYYVNQSGKKLQTLSSRRRGPFQGDVFEEVVYGSDVFGPPACVLLRTDPISIHGLGFDERIVIGPDWDFFTKYASIGRFGYVDRVTCLYRLHTTNISVRTGLKERALELAKCRMNAIQLGRFRDCAARVRAAVFYDLLVNLLVDSTAQQTEITYSQEFGGLPAAEQARLLRLMASATIAHGNDRSHVRAWLDRARRLNPWDWRALVLAAMDRAHPGLLRAFLKRKKAYEVDPRSISPFADVNLSDGE